MSTIPILIDDGGPYGESAVQRGFEQRGRPSRPTLGDEPPLMKSSGVVEVDTRKMRTALNKLTGQISEILGDVRSVGDFRLKQVAVTVEVNAQGSLFLVAKAGAKGGITLTFEAGDR